MQVMCARRLAGGALAACLSMGAAPSWPQEQPSSSSWGILRAQYYGDKPMGLVDESFMSLEVPGNTPDPAATPLTVHLSSDPARSIRRLRVFVDNNPSPLVATFEFGQMPITEIDMHVRVDRFTSVRAVAETAAGGLEMRSAWVRASGGCSAPPTGSSQGGALGQIRLRPSADRKSILVSIRHPNSSGFQIDPRTGDAIPAHFITQIRIEAGGHALLDAQTGISVSENPTFRIASDRVLPMPVSVDAVDSLTQAHFTASTAGSSAGLNGGR